MKLSQINIPFKDEVDDKIYATVIKQMKDLKDIDFDKNLKLFEKFIKNLYKGEVE